MLPSPSSSPARPVLHDRVNEEQAVTPTHRKTTTFLPTPRASEKKRRPGTSDLFFANKRPRISSDSSDDEDESSEEEDVFRAPRCRVRLPNQLLESSRQRQTWGVQSYSTRPILQTFVSSSKTDVYTCRSEDTGNVIPPYACEYTNKSRRGEESVLAVATEEGSVQIIKTAPRDPWDPEPQRTNLRPHTNGIFSLRWDATDTLLATSGGDLSTHISNVTTAELVCTLRAHVSTVKTSIWDPAHRDILATGGRDGCIHIWDLRAAERRNEDGSLTPVKSIVRAHEESSQKPKGRKAKSPPMPKGVTSLAYTDTMPYALFSSGSADGILRYWDLRDPKPARRTKRTKPIEISEPLLISPTDPTISQGARRPRGIASIVSGHGPTSGLLFALGLDSRIHTYSAHTLDPLPFSCAHDRMQTNNFYLGLDLSPCGRWLASGSTGGQGRAFLYDVANAGRPGSASVAGVELKGQVGDVGAVSWARDSLATCADDGTVRVWRPDVARYRQCRADPTDSEWTWSWARD
ncbi:WD40 repeat-like protein [Schizophyllum commune H4-8]|nr:WD40 repeat-like protein [Schizophyllum commune H4-8]KAI5894102.1 WD40 repeat-like protein [Schizophyllum commune H4-8]